MTVANPVFHSIEKETKFKKVSQWGAVLMTLSVLILATSLLVSFPFASHFSITTQVVAHIVTIIIAGVLKVGYVAYIVGKYERNLPF